MKMSEVFVLREAKCPRCGDPKAYIGLNDVECPTCDKEKFVKKLYDAWGDYMEGSLADRERHTERLIKIVPELRPLFDTYKKALKRGADDDAEKIFNEIEDIVYDNWLPGGLLPDGRYVDEL